MDKHTHNVDFAIKNLSRELSAILNNNDYKTKVIPSRKVIPDIRYYKGLLKDLEFHIKEYNVLTGKKHSMEKNIIEFYEGMWYLKKKGLL